MSAYAEYIHAKTEAEREEAMKGIRSEIEKDRYYDDYSFNDVYEHEDYDDEDCEDE